MTKTVPVLLLTGYLGSGKTTLVNHILTNDRGTRFAVIVNDIGEVNIDADLIQKGGIVDQQDDSLVALQNGCICCSLKTDLIKQIEEIVSTHKFDYVVIEASGICEPEPIAQTLLSIQYGSRQEFGFEICKLDCVVTVVDALRMQSEYNCGNELDNRAVSEESLENLIIQQMEFCNIIVLNKVSEVSTDELAQIRQIIRAIQPKAKIIESDYANVNLDELLNTNSFDFEKTSLSATWVNEFDKPTEEHHHNNNEGHEHHHHHDSDEGNEHHHDDEECDDPNCECHHHHDHNDCCHHHHHDHHHSHADEFGIGTFVYYLRKPFDMALFEDFVMTQLDRSVIRCKGIVWFKQRQDMSFLFETAGVQKKLVEAGLWLATAPKEELEVMMANDPTILRDWDAVVGDRMQKLVFIGKNMDKEKLIKGLDHCVVE